MTNQTEPPIPVTQTEVDNILHRLNLGRADIAALPEGATIAINVTTHRQVADIINRLWNTRAQPTPESSLIELIEAARFTHELSDTRIAFNKGIDTAIRLIKGRDDLHPSPDSSLVEKLEALKEDVYFVDGKPNRSPFAGLVNAVIDKAIAIVLHYGSASAIDGETRGSLAPTAGESPAAPATSCPSVFASDNPFVKDGPLKGSEISVMKPCPFCGGNAIRLQGDGRWCQIGCDGCGGRGTEYPNNWEAAERDWNRRTTEPDETPMVIIQTTDLKAHVQKKRGNVRVQFAFYEPEPVSVSLEKCAEAIYLLQPETYYKSRTDGSGFRDVAIVPYAEARNKENAQLKAKAVLDAAGVKYED